MTTLQRIFTPTSATRTQLREMLRAATEVDGVSPFSDQAVLAAENGSRALFAVLRPEDSGGSLPPVGFAVLGAGEVDLMVHPDFRGLGVATEAMQKLLILAQDQPETHVKAWSHGEHPAPRALLRRSGFTEIRTLYQMSLDIAALADAAAQSQAVPADVRIEAFHPHSDTQIEAWLRINSAAFADHPEQGRVTRSDFVALTQEAWFQPEDLVFAVTSSSKQDDYVGFAWVKTVSQASSSEVETELYVLAVHPDAAGLGLGAALFGVTLKRMLAHNPTGVSLYVDASNTRAVALYERAGFRVATQSTQWERSLTVY